MYLLQVITSDNMFMYLLFSFIALLLVLWIAAHIFSMPKIVRQNEVTILLLYKLAEMERLDLDSVRKKMKEIRIKPSKKEVEGEMLTSK
jgi:hypothetical protein